MRKVNYVLGSRAHVMRTRRLHARLRVFVSTYQWHGFSDISMFVDDAPLKHARALRFCSAEPATNRQSQAIKVAVSPPLRA
jgi:hypothetical protein